MEPEEISLYEILGVESTATSSEIRRAFRKLALLYHPDKVPEEERVEAANQFKTISNAYEVLIDEEKKLHYDKYGTTDGSIPARSSSYNAEDSTFGGTAFNGSSYEFDPNDFAKFFNNMGRETSKSYYRPHDNSKSEDAIMDIEIGLEDLYNGKIIKTSSTRNKICPTCKGSGGKKNATEYDCPSCNGSGLKSRLRYMGGGMSVQEEIQCDSCKGSGHYYKVKDRCKRCKGVCVVPETKTLEFNIPKGSPNIGEIVLKNEADESPGLKTGDVILKYKCTENKHYVRKNNDLYTKISISLVDALCGFKDRRLVKSLDHRHLYISVPTGKVLKPGDSIVVPGEGMPIKGSSARYGDLYVGIEVDFPKDNWMLEINDVNKLKTLLDISYGHHNSNKSNEGMNDDSDDSDGYDSDDDERVNVNFKLKSKSELPKSFNSYFNDSEVKTFGVDDNKAQQGGWFKNWFS